ncbi:MAG: orotate phosphoribosyltransferase [Chloroflexi bacterium]|nr:orotate phosphoribosyltransferase [Chloroflexota bacterium]
MNEKLITELYEIGAIQFGKFKLKSGILSPIYLDLRILVSHPRVLRDAARALAEKLGALTFDRIAAIPYAALPIGAALALEMDRPLIYPRQMKKDYGTERVIEGTFNAGETAVVIDDVITTGASKFEAIAPLENARLRVRDVVVLVDREQGGAAEVAARGYTLHAVFTIREIMRVLKTSGAISEAQYREVMDFIESEK